MPNKSNTSNLNSLGETNPVNDLGKIEEIFPKRKTEGMRMIMDTFQPEQLREMRAKKMIMDTLQPKRLREMRAKKIEQQRVSSLKKRRRYIESKCYKGDSKIPDSINEEIIKFLEESPYGTGLPKNIEELLKAQLDYQYKAQLDYQYKIKTEYDFKDKKLDVFNFFANTHNKTIECNFNFYGPFEGINYWSGKAIYYPTKKQFELYDIWPFCKL